MKNTELAQVKGIMKFKGELEKVKPLTLERYTVAEAAEYFGCAKSQIKGYHNNYKDLFGKNIIIEGVAGRQKTIINKDGMFLMAILLNKKSKIAEQVFKNVLNLVIGEQMTLDEAAATKATEKTEETKEFSDKKIEGATIKGKIKTDNVINFDDLKNAKASKNKNNDEVTCIKLELTPEGSKLSRVKVSREEAEEMAKEASKSIPDAIKKVLEEIQNTVEGSDEEECRCPECLEQELIEACHEADMQKLLAESTLEMEVKLTMAYMDKCRTLGIDELDAAIMVQSSIATGDLDATNLDAKILNYLLDQKEDEINKEIGSLEMSLELLADEKCENLHEAYSIFAQEMKYIVGIDLTKYVKSKDYKEILKQVVIAKGYRDGIEVIHNYLVQ